MPLPSRSPWRTAVLVVALLTFAATSGRAQVSVVRRGEENPMLTIAKSTFYGALTGLLLGGATALLAETNEGEIMKWFLVGGTFFGFGYGVYHVSSRPGPSSFLKLGDEAPGQAGAARFRPERAYGLVLPGTGASPATRAPGVRVTLVRLHF